MNLNARVPWLPALLIAIIVALVTSAATTARRQSTARDPQPPEALPAAEFARLIRELSEEGGFFPSDNFTSNESSYLTVVDKLRRLGANGGAYIGVGPEQNFTYIANIRRQAIIQHLMYKAIFHMAPTRAHVLSLLLSRALPKQKAPAPDATINDL